MRDSIDALFEGRIDWSGSRFGADEPIPKEALFGKSKLPIRMVLQRVSDAAIIELPPK